MIFDERINYFENLFDDLQSTNSIVEKKAYIAEIPQELEEDWKMILECLNGVHKFGYTWSYAASSLTPFNRTFNTIKEALDFLLEPTQVRVLTIDNILYHINILRDYENFFEPIVDRTLKLGIGRSLLDKSDLAPMLAKKLEDVTYISGTFTITEKLDGNRCISYWDGTQWQFVSRNGKPMHVKFDMSGLPKEYVYDGEVLSPQQVILSNAIYNAVARKNFDTVVVDQSIFNKTSGLINRHGVNKELVYNIFDIINDDAYVYRRKELDAISFADLTSLDIRILPTLYRANSFEELMNTAPDLLDTVTRLGGEGLMINNDICSYEHKRTKAILKYKKVQTMDMRVVNVEWGTGKYEGMVGALICEAFDSESGKYVRCSVGSGLTDIQRERWAADPESIVHKIVEVAYFSISDTGGAALSLRFPRLKRVRDDKIITSPY